MEEITEQLKQLTGAINAQIGVTRQLESRLKILESKTKHQEDAIQANSAPPRSEQDLKDIARLPDSVRELQTFDGNAVQYISWTHSVENILRDYELVKNKPIYRAILQAIRGKVRGNADAALISYNIFDDNWESIKTCLSLHYADKRDLRTLEYQMSTLTQGRYSIDQFYARVNHQFSLIINKIKTENYSRETINALIESQRNRALDVFIRGVNGELSKYLMLQKPQTLPEAYSTCLELQNYNCRSQTLQSRSGYNTNQYMGKIPSNKIRQPFIPPQQEYQQQQPLTPQQKVSAYNLQHQRPSIPPPRPPKPHEKMEVDRSMQTRQVNYMNRPSNNSNDTYKRPPSTSNLPSNKYQRLFHLETPVEAEHFEDFDDNYDQEYSEAEEEIEEENQEINFMMDARPAYPT